MTKTWFPCALLMVALAACGGGGDDDGGDAAGGGDSAGGGADSGGGGAVSGTTIGGAAISFIDGAGRLNPASAGSLQVRLMNQALGCGWSTMDCNAEFRYLAVTLYKSPPDGSDLEPGTYALNDVGIGLEAYLEQVPASSGPWLCGGSAAHDLILGPSGTITIDTLSETEIAGSLDLQMIEREAPANGHTLSGSFSVPVCP